MTIIAVSAITIVVLCAQNATLIYSSVMRARIGQSNITGGLNKSGKQNTQDIERVSETFV